MAKEVINTMRTVIPATRKDVAKAKSCIFTGSLVICNESPAKYIDIKKQMTEIIAPTISTLNSKPTVLSNAIYLKVYGAREVKLTSDNC